MQRARIENSAVKLAEAAALTGDPWYAQRLSELARELATAARQVLDAARPTLRTRCARWAASPVRRAEHRLARWVARLTAAIRLGKPLLAR